MANMKSFILWFLNNLPDFLLSEPIVYIFGFVILAFVIRIIIFLTNIHKY